jgi:hypothetical protein
MDIPNDEGTGSTETGSTVDGEESTVIKTVKTKKVPKSGTKEAKEVDKKPAKRKTGKKRSRGESATSPRRIAAVEVKQTQALEYRKMGYTYQQIADALGYATAQGAYCAIQSALTRIIREPAEEVLKLELERLDAMFSKPYQNAIGGDLFAVSACLNIMNRKAKLLGLDAPAKVDNTIANKNGIPLATTVHSMTKEEMDAAAKRLLEKY